MRLFTRSVKTETQSRPADVPFVLHTLAQVWVARVSWMVLMALTTGLFVVSLPTYIASLQTICVPSTCTLNQLTSSDAESLQRSGISLQGYASYAYILSIIFATIYVFVALFMFWRKSAEPMVLFTALMLVIFGLTIPGTFASLPGALQPVARSLAELGEVCVILFVYLFPTGHFVPRWSCWLALVWIVDAATGIFGLIPLDAPAWLNLLSFLGFALPAGFSIGAQIYRYRQVSDAVQRQQIKWVVFGIALALGGILLLSLAGTLLSASDPNALPFPLVNLTGFLVCLLALPFSIGIATLHYRLFDIDPLIYRTLVYGTLTVSIMGLYVLVVEYLGIVFHTGGTVLISLLATGLVALLFQPLRLWLQRGLTRLLYGQRDEPYAVLTRLGSRLEGTLAPEMALPTIIATIMDALKLPYAAIALCQEDTYTVVAEQGKPVGDVLTLPVVYAGEPVGQLRLAPRGKGEHFSPADLRLLGDLARQAGAAIHAVQLTMSLQQAREGLILAREEERRRLRNDLHDGVGPQLASLHLKIETARNRLAHEPLAEVLLKDIASQTRAVVADVRRVVYALRPPALDELGLLGALCEVVTQYSYAPQTTRTIQIALDVPEELPLLPAAVEVATYRIAQEALTNVVRHAQASNCSLRLQVDQCAGVLRLEVEDNGRGYDLKLAAGVGVHSMRERAMELGGTLHIEQLPTGGTHLMAHLPYQNEGRGETP